MQRFHLIRDYQVVFRVESVRYLFQSVFVGSRERNHQAFHSDAFKQVTK